MSPGPRYLDRAYGAALTLAMFGDNGNGAYRAAVRAWWRSARDRAILTRSYSCRARQYDQTLRAQGFTV